MSDFHQYGPVTALPRLLPRPVEDLEAAIKVHSGKNPVALVMPMLPCEMDRPALGRILDELRRSSTSIALVVSLNKAHIGRLLALRPSSSRAILAAGHPLERVAGASSSSCYEMQGRRASTSASRGKGRACWLAMGYLLAEERADYIAFQDADVVNYKREMLARLVLPTVDPTVDFDFVKGYYARVSDRLHGRVTRLLLTPLLAAFTRLIGEDPYIRYLASFRYALSGEFAMQERPGAAHAAALRLGARDRRRCSRRSGIARRTALCQVEICRALRPQAPGPVGRRPFRRPAPDGPGRGQAPAADAGRGRRGASNGAAAQPAGRLPARGPGRGRRQLRRCHDQRAASTATRRSSNVQTFTRRCAARSTSSCTIRSGPTRAELGACLGGACPTRARG